MWVVCGCYVGDSDGCAMFTSSSVLRMTWNGESAAGDVSLRARMMNHTQSAERGKCPF